MTNPTEFLTLLDNLETLWAGENTFGGHVFPIDKSSLTQLANAQLLTWEYHTWSNEQLDSIIMFHGGWNVLFGKTVFQEILWLSKSGCGVKLLKTALDFARQKEYDIIMMGLSDKRDNSKLEKLYAKINLEKDGEIWIGSLK